MNSIFTKAVQVVAAVSMFSVTSVTLAQSKPTEIQVWIGLTGQGGELLTKYADQFNKAQTDYKVVVAFKGQYPPHVMQMFDAGSGDMMQAKGAVVPVSEVFKRGGLNFNPADFIPPARGYYGLTNGELLSMPFNVSTTVMFYNKEIFAKAGLNADAPPKTWPEVIKAAQQIREKNAGACGFTTTWLAWVMLEQFSSRHNSPIGTQGNGRAGSNAELTVNNALNQRMIQTLVDGQKTKVFDYGGRSNDAAAKFIAGECGMLMQSSGGLGAINKDAKFKFGVAQLPYWPDVKGAPYATTLGGASLWVFNAPNRSANEFKGVALFLNHLRSTPVMTDWAKETGFVPATNAAFKSMQDEGFFAKNPGRDVPVVGLKFVTCTTKKLSVLCKVNKLRLKLCTTYNVVVTHYYALSRKPRTKCAR
jgi:sn-glycerol 3-phosphate transport system substrate-binding protein